MSDLATWFMDLVKSIEGTQDALRRLGETLRANLGPLLVETTPRPPRRLARRRHHRKMRRGDK